MKILYVSGHPNLGLNDATGYGTHMREVISGFQDLGHTVESFIVGGKEKLAAKKINSNSKKAFIKRFIPKFIWESLKDWKLIQFDSKNKLELERIVKEFAPDLIYERGYYLINSASKTASESGINYYLEYNAPYLEEKIGFGGRSCFHSKAKKIEKENLFAASKVIVVSSALESYFIEKYNIQKDKFIVTPNAINPDNFTIVSNQVVLDLSFIPKDSIVLGFVGSIFPYHGVDLIIKAVSKLIKQHSNILALIVGDGEIIPELKKMAKDLGVSDNIIFTGGVSYEKVKYYINRFDIAIMGDSNWYGSPVKIFEYGFFNKVIIAPNNIPVSDVMKNGIDGLLIQGQEELNEALEDLLAHPEKAKKMGETFGEKVRTKYTWKIVSSQILKP